MLVVKVCRILFSKRGWNEDALQRIGDTMGYGVSGSMMGTEGTGRNGIRSSLDAHIYSHPILGRTEWQCIGDDAKHS